MTFYGRRMEQGRSLYFSRWFLFLSFFFFFFFFFFFCVGLVANLGCRSETCCTRLAENTGRKKVAKNRHLGSIAQLCRAISSQLKHVSTKNLSSSNTASTCPQNMANFGPLTAEICWRVWDTPANLNRFLVLAALLHDTLVVGVSQTLRRLTEGATYLRQGNHHVGHWPTFQFQSVAF